MEKEIKRLLRCFKRTELSEQDVTDAILKLIESSKLAMPKETKFKTLSHCGMYVDANLLEKGIYSCSKPYLYKMDETIETIIERGRMMKDMTGASFITERYFDNLKQCQMVELLITELK
jgi:hypothetical protein